jgi:hypothetical protein
MATASSKLLSSAQWADHSTVLNGEILQGFQDALGGIAQELGQSATCLQVMEMAEQRYLGHPSWGAEIGRAAVALSCSISRSSAASPVLPISLGAGPEDTAAPTTTRLVIPEALAQFVSLTSFSNLEQRYGYAAERPEAFGLMGEFLRNKSPNWRAKPLAEVFEAVVEELPHSKALKILQGLKEMASHGTEATSGYPASTSLFA